jgi:hypothetical protein
MFTPVRKKMEAVGFNMDVTSLHIPTASLCTVKRNNDSPEYFIAAGFQIVRLLHLNRRQSGRYLDYPMYPKPKSRISIQYEVLN